MLLITLAVVVVAMAAGLIAGSTMTKNAIRQQIEQAVSEQR